MEVLIMTDSMTMKEIVETINSEEALRKIEENSEPLLKTLPQSKIIDSAVNQVIYRKGRRAEMRKTMFTPQFDIAKVHLHSWEIELLMQNNLTIETAIKIPISLLNNFKRKNMPLWKTIRKIQGQATLQEETPLHRDVRIDNLLSKKANGSTKRSAQRRAANRILQHDLRTWEEDLPSEQQDSFLDSLDEGDDTVFLVVHTRKGKEKLIRSILSLLEGEVVYVHQDFFERLMNRWGPIILSLSEGEFSIQCEGCPSYHEDIRDDPKSLGNAFLQTMRRIPHTVAIK